MSKDKPKIQNIIPNSNGTVTIYLEDEKYAILDSGYDIPDLVDTSITVYYSIFALIMKQQQQIDELTKLLVDHLSDIQEKKNTTISDPMALLHKAWNAAKDDNGKTFVEPYNKAAFGYVQMWMEHVKKEMSD